MKNRYLPEVDLVLYHNNVPVGVYKSDHIGVLGIHVCGYDLNYKIGTSLEIEVLGPDKTCVDDNRMPVMVTSSTDAGIGLRLEYSTDDCIVRWQFILKDIFSVSRYKKSDDNTIAA